MNRKRTLAEFDARLPRFPLSSSQIDILDSPSRFHATLVSKISAARRCIFLTSLYIGCDAVEVISALRKALGRHRDLRVYILLDRLRGSRRDSSASQSSLAILAPLIREFGPLRVEIRCYHTPNLRGIWKYTIPKRLNEGFGLQHIKLYGVDDEVIVTGANLSGEYFTNRQDRYYVFRAACLTRYFRELVLALGGFSYLLRPTDGDGGFALDWPSSNYTHRPLEETSAYELQQAACLHLLPLLWGGTGCPDTVDAKRLPEKPAKAAETDTVIYPLAQLVPLLGPSTRKVDQRPLSTHEWALSHVMSFLPEVSSWTLSTPYLSFPDKFQNSLIEIACSRSRIPEEETGAAYGIIVTAAPQAMSFWGARGLAGYIPRAFAGEVGSLTKKISNRIEGSHNTGVSSQLLQWRRGTAHEPLGWTYHAKGWWIHGQDLDGASADGINNKSQRTTAVMIGSSNYGQRSFSLDLEVDVLLVTSNMELRARIEAEERSIIQFGTVATKENTQMGGLLEGILVWFLMSLIRILGLSI